jgi:aminopeptidase N
MRLPSLVISLCSVATLFTALVATAQPATKTTTAMESPLLDHSIRATIDIETGQLDVTDTITIPDGFVPSSGVLTAVLHGGLNPTSPDAEVTVVESLGSSESSMKGESRGIIPTDVITIRPRAGARSFTLRYAGVIQHAPAPSPLEHARSFSETAGTIGREGVYLAGSSRWLARFGGELSTFTLVVDGLPAGFSVVSEGDEISKTAPFQFRSQSPVDDIHLIAGPFVRTEKLIDGVAVVTLLRASDPALAERYTEVTGQYLKMYHALIGAYPWSRFALVENFWETGYGMPGFTLLGPKIIRFPFILHSSYPHELLHNWWGNSVYLPMQGDNWCEGMTAYLADHLVEDQRGKSAEYRQRTIAKYMDFVRPENDFAVRTFSGRFSPASEAIGYGKWLMIIHMLRRELGDEKFKAMLQDFYATNRFRRTTFTDIERAASKAAGRDMHAFFSGWLDEKGMPTVRWSDVRAARARGGAWSVSVALEQAQAGKAFPLRVPVVVTLHDGRTVEDSVVLTSRNGNATIAVPDRPVRVDIDPRFDVFRSLDKGEIAPSLSLSLGAKRAVFVIPTQAADDEIAAWRTFAETLCPAEAGSACDIVDDTAMQSLPTDAAVWILGYGNSMRAAAMVGVKKLGARFDDYTFRVGEAQQSNGERSVMIALRNPRGDDHGLVFVGSDNLAAIPGLARKLPHYGKYGYLGFQGDEPVNVLKGAWAPVGSPMTVVLDPRAKVVSRMRSPPPLASLPPPFDGTRMKKLVDVLAAPDMEGRGYGTKGLERAIDVVTNAFKAARLAPFHATDLKQCVTDPAGPDGKPVNACNVVGAIVGEDPKLPAVVLAAHVDHLGKGWPEARKGEAGKIHPGANDNASGVAVLLELVHALSAQGPQKRTIVFVALTGEEAGLRGARRFVDALGPRPDEKVMAMVNLDTVGRRDGAKKLLVLGGESAKEWVHIFMGIGFVTGVESELAAQGLMASDHVAFLEKGVPAVQIFSGPSLDYHRPSDTADKVEEQTLVDVAVFTREAMVYLAGRETPLSSTLQGAKAPAPVAADERKVTLGTVPDFAFAGPGVRMTGVTPGSPADKAGLKSGDVLIEMGGEKVRDMRHYADLLRARKPGDKVQIRVQRGSDVLTHDIVLMAR